MSYSDDGDKLGPDGISRRRFLAGTAAAIAATHSSRLLTRCWGADEPAPKRQPEISRAQVLEVGSEHLVFGRTVHTRLLGEMLELGLVNLTGQADQQAAWQNLLGEAKVIGLKFNQSAAANLGTTPPMARVLVKSLVDSGWSAENIIPIEIPHALHQELGTTPPRRDWLDEEVEIGERKDRLSGVLGQVDALINIPFLKTHNIAGLTCCLKNLSHGLIKHPAQFHDNNCSPHVARIVALPQIRDKLRVHIVNAMRVVFDQGPEAIADFVSDRGALLMGTDPVALDRVGIEILNQERFKAQMDRIQDDFGQVKYLAAATELGLGISDLHLIDYLKFMV